MWQKRVMRWRRKVLVLGAMLPMFQATGTCDPYGLNAAIFSSLTSATFNVFVGAMQQTLLQFFPSSEILATLFGANRSPFF